MSDALVDLVRFLRGLDSDVLYSMWLAAQRQVSRELEARNEDGADAWSRFGDILNDLYEEREGEQVA